MGSDIRSHRDLKIWQLGMEIAERCYETTRRFPREEIYGLTAQIRRAASSVPANIAEGNGRGTTKEYLRFLSIAQGSLCELETFLELSQRLNYLEQGPCDTLRQLLAEEGRMIRGLQRTLRSKLA
jgi:four helix bundle protein